MDEREQRRHCERLRSLYVPGDPVVLPNAWDAASARAVAAAGFEAVATTSAGVAATLGYEDHERAPAAEMLQAAARIARSVDLPVTVDADSGYGRRPTSSSQRSGTGAAGCNLEDTDHGSGTLRDPGSQIERMSAVSRRGGARGRSAGAERADRRVRACPRRRPASLVQEAFLRARAYLDAGADCVHPIALSDDASIETFVAECPGPVNVLVSPTRPRLERLGVARVSYGSSIHTASMQELAAFLEGARDRLGRVLSPKAPGDLR